MCFIQDSPYDSYWSFININNYYYCLVHGCSTKKKGDQGLELVEDILKRGKCKKCKNKLPPFVTLTLNLGNIMGA